MTDDGRKYNLRVTVNDTQFECDNVTYDPEQRILLLNVNGDCGTVVLLEELNTLLIEKWQI